MERSYFLTYSRKQRNAFTEKFQNEVVIAFYYYLFLDLQGMFGMINTSRYDTMYINCLSSLRYALEI